MPTKIGMVSLGCPKNQVDAEMMLYTLRDAGFELSQDPALADAVIINTCGFIESAKQEAIEETMEYIALKKEGRIKKIILTGCLAERYRDEIREEMPEVDAVVGIGSNKDIVSIVREVFEDRICCRYGEKCDLPLEGGRILSTLPFYAYLKIAEGCDNRCSYCAIPNIRGPFRSRPMEGLLEEAKGLAEKGVKELVVVAQDPTKYGKDLYGEYKIAELLQELAKIDGFRWIRLLYAYPEKITEELLDVMAKEPKIAKYLDLPIQHCNQDVLRAMRRPGNREQLETLIAHIREKIPGVTLRTTLIAGFPGETEEQFAELCEFVKSVRFDRLGCFAYSQEEGTPAGEMENQIDEGTKAERARIVTEEQMNIMAEKNEGMIGKEFLCVVEGYDRWGECFFGRSEADAPDIDGKVFFTSENKLAVGQFVRVKIEDTMDLDLMGVVIDEHAE
ncbi:MAG TPA: 30S ribosomal protein S12 methylthiotransferase RimO [Candidatus Merdivicinus intestinigallinarum]|nr:30S ribosomal protein S12 methylthiotransferase RimO [Candidatus Merdivicinus intestinigallinarum]